jgi:hypothetical protein
LKSHDDSRAHGFGCEATHELLQTLIDPAREVGQEVAAVLKVNEEAAWWVRDLGARNGVKVNGERIEDVRKLAAGDEIQLGTCRMRLDVVASNPLASAQKVAFELARNPVGAVKNDPRVRRGLAAAIAAAILLAIAGAGGGAAIGPNPESGPWLQIGAKHLVAGEYEQARTVFRRRAKVYSDTGDATPRTLAQIAGQWMHLDERGARVFRWEKATELLNRTARLKGLPPTLRTWLEKQTDRVDLNSKAVAILLEAEQLAARATTEAAEGKLQTALENYQQATNRFESVDAGSMVAREALDGAAKVANQAFEHVTAHLRKAAAAKRPDWNRLLHEIERGERFAVDTKDRALLRRLGEACRTNLEDEDRFVAAGKLIKQQNATRYDRARKLLEAVNPRSKIYPDALAYLDWLEADTKVREATQAYSQAFGKRAFQLLSEAYACRSLGADAKQSISVRRTHWSRVVKSYERGMTRSHDGDKLEALSELKRVLELEQDPHNRYRARAKSEIETIEAQLVEQLKRHLQSGLAALKRGQLREANTWFEEVRADPTKSTDDLRTIEAAVAKRNAREKMLPRAKRQLIKDNRETFLKLRDVFALLARWLPQRHEGRAQAKKHLKVVAARIRSWEKAAENSLK